MDKKILIKRPPNVKWERNARLVNLYFDPESNYSMEDVARLFEITKTRVWQIIQAYKKSQQKGGEKE